MKIAFYTSTLGDEPIDEIIGWAKKTGFDGIEIDVNRHLADSIGPIVERVRQANLEIPSITLFGNLLHPDKNERDKIRGKARTVARQAADAGVPILVLFPGRNGNANEEENYRDVSAFLAELAATKSDGTFKIALENWPGMHKNFVGTTPNGWQKLFEQVVSPNVGLEFDPSHLLWQGIDPYRAAFQFRDRIFLLHGKDTKLFPDRLQAVGYGGPWWEYRLPGRGELDWVEFLRFVRVGLGFDGYVSIEHEDSAYAWPNGDLLTRRKGFEVGLDVLRRALTS